MSRPTELVDLGCGETHGDLGIACMLPIPFGETEHRGDHRAWSTVEDDDQSWVLKWVNLITVRNLRVWRSVNCRQPI